MDYRRNNPIDEISYSYTYRRNTQTKKQTYDELNIVVGKRRLLAMLVDGEVRRGARGAARQLIVETTRIATRRIDAAGRQRRAAMTRGPAVAARLAQRRVLAAARIARLHASQYAARYAIDQLRHVAAVVGEAAEVVHVLHHDFVERVGLTALPHIVVVGHAVQMSGSLVPKQPIIVVVSVVSYGRNSMPTYIPWKNVRSTNGVLSPFHTLSSGHGK
jgi:hypothetical protein